MFRYQLNVCAARVRSFDDVEQILRIQFSLFPSVKLNLLGRSFSVESHQLVEGATRTGVRWSASPKSIWKVNFLEKEKILKTYCKRP